VYDPYDAGPSNLATTIDETARRAVERNPPAKRTTLPLVDLWAISIPDKLSIAVIRD